MHARTLVLFLLALLGAAGRTRAGAAPSGGFHRYSVILARKPFGEPPSAQEGPAPDVVPSFSKDLRLSGIMQLGDILRVGIVDTKQKKSYYLKVGDKEDGFEVVSADFEESEVLLRKGEETAVLRLTHGAGSPSPAPRQQPKPRPRPFQAARTQITPPTEPLPPGSRGPTIEKFLREHPEAMVKGNFQFPPPNIQPAEGRGETIERLLREMQEKKDLDE